MILTEGDLQFEFTGALDAFKFDETDKSLSHFHGLSHCMKAVDFIAEYSNYYVFIEIKSPPDPSRYGTNDLKNELIKSLVGKFRDSFIYRWAENKLDKPVRYQCLVELDNAQTLFLMKTLQRELPITGSTRWAKPIVESCSLVNIKSWNAIFPDIQVSRV